MAKFHANNQQILDHEEDLARLHLTMSSTTLGTLSEDAASADLVAVAAEDGESRAERIEKGQLSEREVELVHEAVAAGGGSAKVVFMGWALFGAPNAAKQQPRVLVVTEHRVLLFKKAAFTRKGKSRLRVADS